MRVAIDARWNHHGGVAKYLSHILDTIPKSAAARGIEIVTYENDQGQSASTQPNRRRVYVSSGRYSLSAQYELAVRIKKDNIDLFHSPFYWMPFFAGCPVIITIHDVMPFLFPLYGRIHQQLVKAGYRAAAKRCTHIAAVSRTTEEDVIKILNVSSNKVSTIYCGLDFDVFCSWKVPDEVGYLQSRYGITQPYVLTMSASNWKTKNLVGALQAIEKARDESSISFQTVIVGSEIGLNQSGQRDILRQTVVTGPVPTEDLAKLYRNTAVFVAISNYEGFGFPLAEAMASGAPCIASTGGSLEEIAGDGAIVRAPEDIEGITHELVSLLATKEKRQELSRKAIERSSEFSLHRFSNSLLDLYGKVAKSEAVRS